MQDYVNKLKTLRTRIIAANGLIDDTQMNAKLISRLPRKYITFKTTFYLMPSQERDTIDKVSRILTNKEHLKTRIKTEQEATL